MQRQQSQADRRVQIAELTDAGFQRLKAAYPAHLASVRRHVTDHFGDLDLDELAEPRSRTSHKPARRRRTTDELQTETRSARRHRLGGICVAAAIEVAL